MNIKLHLLQNDQMQIRLCCIHMTICIWLLCFSTQPRGKLCLCTMDSDSTLPIVYTLPPVLVQSSQHSSWLVDPILHHDGMPWVQGPVMEYMKMTINWLEQYYRLLLSMTTLNFDFYLQFLVSGRDLACQQKVSLALTKTPPIHYYNVVESAFSNYAG